MSERKRRERRRQRFTGERGSRAAVQRRDAEREAESEGYGRVGNLPPVRGEQAEHAPVSRVRNRSRACQETRRRKAS
jgi:hypothetical protein